MTPPARVALEPLDAIAARIGPLDADAMAIVARRLDRLTKPPGSLGRLETLALELAGIRGEPVTSIDRPAIVVFAGDHGIARQGVSPYPPEVTRQMVANFAAGGAAINVLSRVAGATLVVVDVGVGGEPTTAPDARSRPARTRRAWSPRGSRRGTRDFSVEPGDDRGGDAWRRSRSGGAIAAELAVDGCDLLGVGDMGIGNTTASSAIVAALLDRPARDVTGRGTGLDDDGVRRKAAVIETRARAPSAGSVAPARRARRRRRARDRGHRRRDPRGGRPPRPGRPRRVHHRCGGPRRRAARAGPAGPADRRATGPSSPATGSSSTRSASSRSSISGSGSGRGAAPPSRSRSSAPRRGSSARWRRSRTPASPTATDRADRDGPRHGRRLRRSSADAHRRVRPRALLRPLGVRGPSTSSAPRTSRAGRWPSSSPSPTTRRAALWDGLRARLHGVDRPPAPPRARSPRSTTRSSPTTSSSFAGAEEAIFCLIERRCSGRATTPSSPGPATRACTRSAGRPAPTSRSTSSARRTAGRSTSTGCRRQLTPGDPAHRRQRAAQPDRDAADRADVRRA